MVERKDQSLNLQRECRSACGCPCFLDAPSASASRYVPNPADRGPREGKLALSLTPFQKGAKSNLRFRESPTSCVEATAGTLFAASLRLCVASSPHTCAVIRGWRATANNTSSGPVCSPRTLPQQALKFPGFMACPAASQGLGLARGIFCVQARVNGSPRQTDSSSSPVEGPRPVRFLRLTPLALPDEPSCRPPPFPGFAPRQYRRECSI